MDAKQQIENLVMERLEQIQKTLTSIDERLRTNSIELSKVSVQVPALQKQNDQSELKIEQIRLEIKRLEKELLEESKRVDNIETSIKTIGFFIKGFWAVFLAAIAVYFGFQN